MQKTCLTCAKCFVTFDKRNKYCSLKCRVPWNKGTIGLQKAWNKGLKGFCAGQENGMWKGESVGREALHGWVKRMLGRASRCDKCGTVENRMYHWSNISEEYKRDIADWWRLCVPCHKKFDLQKKTYEKECLECKILFSAQKQSTKWCGKTCRQRVLRRKWKTV